MCVCEIIAANLLIDILQHFSVVKRVGIAGSSYLVKGYQIC